MQHEIKRKEREYERLQERWADYNCVRRKIYSVVIRI